MIQKQLIKIGIKQGMKKIKNPKVKKGISGFLKILAGLAFLRSIISLFGIDFGDDNEIEVDNNNFNIDTDGDGISDAFGSDIDGDGIIDSVHIDTDGDGIVDTIQFDSDGDGFMDEEIIDMDGDGQFGSLEDELERDYIKKMKK